MLRSYLKNEPELHLFIIWNNGQKYKNQILSLIKERLCIRLIKDLKWKEEDFSQNLRRFYGRNLPEKSNKAKECGLGVFTIVVVEDNTPVYAPRYTNQGVQIVNVHMFDFKELFRGIAKCNVIHATNTEAEFEHDVTLLLGINPQDLVSKDFNVELSSNEYISLIGSNGWKDINELFYALNSSANYVVLRNFEKYPDSIQYGEHSDIDILCDNYNTVRLLLNGNPTSTTKNRVQNKIKVGDSYVNVDIRYVGDNYLDSNWESDILQRRVFRENGFYTPCDIDYLYSMAYHALIQKNKISNDYITRAKSLSELNKVKILDLSNEMESLACLSEYLDEKGYSYVEPLDPTVAFNFFKINAKVGFKRRIHYAKHFLGSRIKG